MSASTRFDSGERKQAELALRESEDRFRKIVEQAPIAMAVVGMDGTIEFINRKAVQVFGYLSEDIPTMERWWFQAYPDAQYRNEVVTGWMSLVHQAVREGTEIPGQEYQVTCKDGTVKTVVISGACISEKVFVLFDDVTKRKHMEQALLESEQHYRMVSELVTDYAFKLDVAADGAVTMVFVSDNFNALTGRTKDDARTVDLWGKIIHPDDLGRTMGLLRKLVASPQSIELECRSFIHNGKLRWVGIIARSEWDEKQQRVTAILGAVKDISERKWAEAAIAEEKERLAVTLRSIGDGVITTDTRGAIVIMNSVAEALTGWTQAEAEGRPLDDIFITVSETTRERCASSVERVLSTGRIVELASHVLLVSRQGTERLIADSGAPITDRDGKTIGVVLVFRDITEKQRVSEVMQRAAKLDALGILAGGIAHDFNNLLTGIFGYVELARSRSSDEQVVEYLDGTLAAMNRAKALSMQLLTFAKGGAPAQKRIQMIPLIRETVQFALSGASVSCQFSMPDDLWSCHVDRNQIAQVIDNIVINAQQAMPHGGFLEVAARNVFADESRLPALTRGNYVKLSIKDQGIGIPKDVLPRIFDPFYTTKTKGHGLGLATCYSIVSRHGGCIEVESELGKGSLFHVYLPAVVEGAATKAD